MTSTPAQFAAKMHRVAGNIQQAPRGIAERGAMANEGSGSVCATT
jgi:hypothetical protein